MHTDGAHRHIPPLVELDKVLHAARALEEGVESAEDLQYLLGQGTSLGGARPKSTDRRESKIWLTEDSGPIDSRQMLMEGAPYFRLSVQEATTVRDEVTRAVGTWRSIGKELGMRSRDLTDFEPALRHELKA